MLPCFLFFFQQSPRITCLFSHTRIYNPSEQQTGVGVGGDGRMGRCHPRECQRNAPACASSDKPPLTHCHQVSAAFNHLSDHTLELAEERKAWRSKGLEKRINATSNTNEGKERNRKTLKNQEPDASNLTTSAAAQLQEGRVSARFLHCCLSGPRAEPDPRRYVLDELGGR